MVASLRGWASFDHMGKSLAVASSAGFPVGMLGRAGSLGAGVLETASNASGGSWQIL